MNADNVPPDPQLIDRFNNLKARVLQEQKYVRHFKDAASGKREETSKLRDRLNMLHDSVELSEYLRADNDKSTALKIADLKNERKKQALEFATNVAEINANNSVLEEVEEQRQNRLADIDIELAGHRHDEVILEEKHRFLQAEQEVLDEEIKRNKVILRVQEKEISENDDRITD